MTSAYVRTSVQTLGEGEGSPKATRRGKENVIFYRMRIFTCEKGVSLKAYFKAYLAKRLFDSVEVLNLRKNIKYL